MTQIRMPICMVCKHRNKNGQGFTCAAFPRGIPNAIIRSRHDHREGYRGDNGIRFEPEDADAAEYADELFGLTRGRQPGSQSVSMDRPPGRPQVKLYEFNPYHDPATGRFTSGPSAGEAGVITSPGGNRAGGAYIDPRDTGEPGPYGPDVDAAADSLSARARAVEPEVTSSLVEVAAEVGGDMEGLRFRFKAEDGIERKIGKKKLEQGLETDEAASQINDALRYTMTFDEASYHAGVNATLNAVTSEGAKVYLKNYWASEGAYKGINGTVTEPDGFTWELQFHTPSSFKTKMANHGPYERARDVNTSPSEAARLVAEMAASWSSVPVPANVTDLGTLMEALDRTTYWYGLDDPRQDEMPAVPRGLLRIIQTKDEIYAHVWSNGAWVASPDSIGYHIWGEPGAWRISQQEAELIRQQLGGPLEEREFSQSERKAAAKKGQAMSHGGFPIKSRQDLKNAIRALGRAKDRAAAKRHIIKRAKALGLTSLLPQGWLKEAELSPPGFYADETPADMGWLLGVDRGQAIHVTSAHGAVWPLEVLGEYNPYRDMSSGRFTFGPGGSGSDYVPVLKQGLTSRADQAKAAEVLAERDGESEEDRIQRLADTWNELTPEMQAQAKAWYPAAFDLAAEIGEEHGFATHEVAGAIAATSAAKGWNENLRLAREISQVMGENDPLEVPGDYETSFGVSAADYNGKWAEKFPNAGLAGQDFTGTRLPSELPPDLAFALLSDAGRINIFRHPGEKAIAALQGYDARDYMGENSNKTASFYANITNPGYDGVTVDRHMWRAMGNNSLMPDKGAGSIEAYQKGTASGSYYAYTNTVFKAAAKKAGVPARDFQAGIWLKVIEDRKAAGVYDEQEGYHG